VQSRVNDDIKAIEVSDRVNIGKDGRRILFLIGRKDSAFGERSVSTFDSKV